MNRFKVEVLNNGEYFIEDNYMGDSFNLTNRTDINIIVEMLNIANNVLGDEFEAVYEDKLWKDLDLDMFVVILV